MGKHAPCSPSSLFRRKLCPRSMQMEQGQPDQTSADAERGTDLHALTEAILLGKASLEDVEKLPEWEGYLVDRCVAAVRETMEANPQAALHCEYRVDLKWLHPAIGGGTIDAVLVEPYSHAILFDFKFGSHRVPPAAENYQLAVYGAGIMREFDLAPDRVTIHVLQPGAWHNSSAILADCAKLIEEAGDIAARAHNPEAPLVPGLEQCRYCKAAAVCPALLASFETLEQLKKKTAPDQLTEAQVVDALNAADEVETFIGAIRQRAFSILTSGGTVDGWCLAPGRASYSWVDGAREKLEEIAARLERDPKTLLTEPELKSVSALKKSWGRSKAVLSELDPLVVKNTTLTLTKGGTSDVSGKEE